MLLFLTLYHFMIMIRLTAVMHQRPRSRFPHVLRAASCGVHHVRNLRPCVGGGIVLRFVTLVVAVITGVGGLRGSMGCGYGFVFYGVAEMSLDCLLNCTPRLQVLL